jgi:hypothetical protein
VREPAVLSFPKWQEAPVWTSASSPFSGSLALCS